MAPSDSPKHLQLGADLDADDRTPLSDEARDDVWADATTVEDFKRDIELLASGGA